MDCRTQTPTALWPTVPAVPTLVVLGLSPRNGVVPLWGQLMTSAPLDHAVRIDAQDGLPMAMRPDAHAT